MIFAPSCSFSLVLAKGVVTPGERVEGTLIVQAPQAIPNATGVVIAFRSAVIGKHELPSGRSLGWSGRATYGLSVRRELFVDTMTLALPHERGLVAGRHRLAFAFDTPPWLPPRAAGPGWSVEHELETRLVVASGFDVTQTFPAKVAPSPVTEPAAPAVFQSPPTFHDAVFAEVVLDAVAISNRSPLTGRVSVRGALGARFDALTLTLESAAKLHLLGGAVRTIALDTQRIPAEELRDGSLVPFRFTVEAETPPTFKTGVIDHHLRLWVGLEKARRSAPFSIGLRMLHRGSFVEHDGGPPDAATRSPLAEEAAAMAGATGLRRGELPVIIEGAIGPVDLRITDEPRAGALGVRVELSFPEVTVRAFDRHKLIGGLGHASDLELSDTHLEFHVAVTQSMVAVANDAKARAEAIIEAITELPFAGDVAERAAWQATAVEQEGFLVPHLPALHRLAFRAQTLAGETRTLCCTLRTETHAEAGRTILAELDLRELPLTANARAALANTVTPPDVLRSVRTQFETVVVESATSLTLARRAWTPDPRVLFPALQLLFDWVLDARGERRVESPYR